MTVNACALGRHTVAVTKGAIETFNPEELKAIIAHEIAHIIYGDTIARLYAKIGNGFFTLFVLISMAFIFIAELIEKMYCKKKESFSFAWVMIALVKFLFVVIVYITQLLMNYVMSFSSRKSEFRADKYAFELGYGESLVEAFYLMEKLQLGDNATVLQRMTADHPRITSRIEFIEELLERENAVHSSSSPLS
jgi:heat shock protein HtpX